MRRWDVKNFLAEKGFWESWELISCLTGLNGKLFASTSDDQRLHHLLHDFNALPCSLARPFLAISLTPILYWLLPRHRRSLPERRLAVATLADIATLILLRARGKRLTAEQQRLLLLPLPEESFIYHHRLIRIAAPKRDIGTIYQRDDNTTRELQWRKQEAAMKISKASREINASTTRFHKFAIQRTSQLSLLLSFPHLLDNLQVRAARTRKALLNITCRHLFPFSLIHGLPKKHIKHETLNNHSNNIWHAWEWELPFRFEVDDAVVDVLIP